MFRREGLTEIKADIASSDDSPSLRGMAHALVCMVEHADDELAQLTAENERLLRVVEQAIDCGSLEVVTITEDNNRDFLNGWRNVGKTIIAGIGDTEKFIAGYPEGNEDLYAQLKGADRG
jgi:hypothetical protein